MVAFLRVEVGVLSDDVLDPGDGGIKIGTYGWKSFIRTLPSEGDCEEESI